MPRIHRGASLAEVSRQVCAKRFLWSATCCSAIYTVRCATSVHILSRCCERSSPKLYFHFLLDPRTCPPDKSYLQSSSWRCVLLQVRLVTFQSMRHQCVSMTLPFSTLCSIWAYIKAFWTLVACPDESRTSRLNSPSMSCSIQFFIPASWETIDPDSAALNRRAELWGEIDSPAGTQYFFLTIGFVNSVFLAPASYRRNISQLCIAFTWQEACLR